MIHRPLSHLRPTASPIVVNQLEIVVDQTEVNTASLSARCFLNHRIAWHRCQYQYTLVDIVTVIVPNEEIDDC